MTYLRLFGRPEVDHAGEAVALPADRCGQLIALLALRRSWVGRGEMAAMFWPDLASERAYANLRKVLHRTRAFAWSAALDVQSGALRFDVASDVADFGTALAEGRTMDAVRARRGELLENFDDDSSAAWSAWLGFERNRLRTAWRDATLALASADGDASEAIDLSARLLADDPLDEAALHAHMAALARAGQSAKARRAYEDFAHRLADELGLPPSVDVKALHDSLGKPTVAPVVTTPSELRPADRGFVGRSVELRQCAALLAQRDCRLLNFVGPGGVGKSRLARHAMLDLAPRYADGATFVALEDVGTASEIGARLARDLGVTRAAHGDPLEQVIESLRDGDKLLVLDNLEHLAADTTPLARLLDECPRLKIIVTSRTRLGLATEWLLAVEGLPYPDPEDEDRAEAFDAVQLFLQTAQRVQPDIAVAAERSAIVDICRQVEGLPLALEITAGWTRVLSCAAIAAQLREGTELLRAVDPGRLPRQASMDAVFDQSWRQLTAIERDVLARLSVFRGGFSVDAARAVAGASLPVLAALADRSLLRKAATRAHLHPLVQQLAGARLADASAAQATASAHASFFHATMTRARRAVEYGERGALDEIDAELDNCRSAWRHAVASRDGGALLRSTATLMYFFDHRGRFAEGVAMFADALSALGDAADPAVAATLLAAVAHLEYRLDRYADADAGATRALALARSARNPEALTLCLKVLGACNLAVGRHPVARRYFEQTRRQALASADLRTAAAMLDNLALIQRVLGHYDAAMRLSLDSLVQHRQLAIAPGIALCLNNLAVLELAKDEFEAARVHLREALDICERHGIFNTRVMILANLMEIGLRTGDLEAAEDFGKRALDAAQTTGNRYAAAWTHFEFVRLAARRHDLAAARSHLRAGLETAIATGRQRQQLLGIACFGEILAAAGETDCARRIWTFACEHPLTDAPERAEFRRRIAELPAAAAATTESPLVATPDELAHRIVAETDSAHAALIASLRRA